MIRQVVFWSAIVLTLSLTHSKQMQNIDAITQAYLTAEKYLWQLIYSTDRYNRLETFAYIYDTHEEHLGKNMGESGRFERLKRMHPTRHRDYRDYRDTRSSTWRVIDAIEEINATALNTYRILSHRTYDTLPHLVNDTGENIPREIASICKHIDEEFWIAAKNVSPISIYCVRKDWIFRDISINFLCRVVMCANPTLSSCIRKTNFSWIFIKKLLRPCSKGTWCCR